MPYRKRNPLSVQGREPPPYRDRCPNSPQKGTPSPHREGDPHAMQGWELCTTQRRHPILPTPKTGAPRPYSETRTHLHVGDGGLKATWFCLRHVGGSPAPLTAAVSGWALREDRWAPRGSPLRSAVTPRRLQGASGGPSHPPLTPHSPPCLF